MEKPAVEQKAVVKLDAEGKGFVYYPSGRIAVNIQSGAGSTGVSLFFNDNARGTMLASIDFKGEGSINYPDGQPRLVLTSKHARFHDEAGNVASTWAWKDGPLDPPVTLYLNTSLSVVVASLRSIQAAFQTDAKGGEVVLDVGARSKRDSTYLDKMVSKHRTGPTKGKVELDMAAVRAQEHVYHMSDKSKKSDAGNKSGGAGGGSPGGSSRGSKTGVQDPALQAVVSNLEASDASVSSLRCLVHPPSVTGTARPPPPHSPITPNMLDERGLLKTSKEHQDSLRRFQESRNPKRIPPKLVRLEPVKQVELDRFVRETAAPDELVLVCCLGDWSPPCRAAEAVLQQANYQLQQLLEERSKAQAAEIPAPNAATTSRAMFRARMVKADMAEGRLLMERYHFGALPMYFMFLGGRLAHAGCDFYDHESSVGAILKQLEVIHQRASGGKFLPDNFRFKDGMDQAALETIADKLRSAKVR